MVPPDGRSAGARSPFQPLVERPRELGVATMLHSFQNAEAGRLKQLGQPTP